VAAILDACVRLRGPTVSVQALAAAASSCRRHAARFAAGARTNRRLVHSNTDHDNLFIFRRISQLSYCWNKQLFPVSKWIEFPAKKNATSHHHVLNILHPTICRRQAFFRLLVNTR
jgi:hypothetical protein